ncbi:hypothetical protein [Bordetella petrii]|uniref:DUF4239 domain-containing protein n=1 Tax=Bordetella petrii TaxID=94624 RepID=A0ABT7VZB3_9BORD|nr:hypothetical protein [Bordetella petrii]MDM9558283.1 hypothetical protein [Bordetella petrii]
MNYSFALVGLAVLFFFLLFAAIQVGRYMGGRRGREEVSGRSGAAAIEASVFALLGLLVAFTFSGAAQRMADRRHLLVQEVNAIGTAWLRIDMINAADQPVLREQFRRYVDARIDYYRHVADLDKREAIANRVAAIQKEIWASSMQAAGRSTPPFAASYAGAVNEMFDVATSLTVAQKVHPPVVTYLFLCFLALVCGCFVGLNLAEAKRGGLVHQGLYALVMTAALYIIVDFEFPRIGTIRIDQGDTLLISQRDAMNDPAGR